jgi:hypothetical protein
MEGARVSAARALESHGFSRVRSRLLSFVPMRLAFPPPVMLVALLASGCPRGDAPTPASGAVRAQVPADGPARTAAELDRGPQGTRALAPRVEPRIPETSAIDEPKAERLELTFVGDIIFGRYRGDGSFAPIIADPTFDPFAEIRPALRSDVVVGNLETPVVEQLPDSSPLDTPYRFGGSRQMVHDWLDGFTIVSLANNHCLDLGVDGQRESPRILAEEGIVPIGAARTSEPLHRVETYSTKGWRIGLLAVTTLLNVDAPAAGPKVPFVELADMSDTLLPLVERARADHDLVVVVVHWGDEYFAAPSRRQQQAAHRLLEAGADVVIGHHPHVLQAIERHGEGLVAYSLGNFLFEHTTSSPRLMGVLRTVWHAAPEGAELGGSYLVDAVLHTAVNERTPHPHPAPATGELSEQVRERIVRLSARQGSRWTRIAGTEDLRLVGKGLGPKAPAQ